MRTNHKISKVERDDLIVRARRFESDRYVNGQRIIPVSGYLVAFAPGEDPVIDLDVWNAGPAMERAACMAEWLAYGDGAIERIAARHRALERTKRWAGLIERSRYRL